MKRCKYCGWWFEPSKPRQVYCDDECRHEAELITKREWWRKNKGTAKKTPSILKVDVSKLPPPYIAADERSQARRQEFAEAVRADGKEAGV